MDEQDPGHVAQTDQAVAAARDVAKVVGSYHKSLLEQGFSADQAFTLALAYQTAICKGGA